MRIIWGSALSEGEEREVLRCGKGGAFRLHGEAGLVEARAGWGGERAWVMELVRRAEGSPVMWGRCG